MESIINLSMTNVQGRHDPILEDMQLIRFCFLFIYVLIYYNSILVCCFSI